MDSTRSNLLEALKQVERRTENSASGWRLLLYLLVLVPALTATIPYVMGDSGAYLLAGFLPSVMILGISLWYSVGLRKYLQSELNDSDLLMRVVALEDDPIFDATPWPWRLLLTGKRSENRPANLLQRVGWNLDWYLRPKERLFRIQWIFTPLLLIAVLIYNVTRTLPVVAETIRLQRWASSPADVLLSVALSLAYTVGPTMFLLLPLIYLYHRRQIWTEELVRHLRERLQA